MSPKDDEGKEQLRVTENTLALLEILALGNRQIEDGEVEPARAVVARLRSR